MDLLPGPGSIECGAGGWWLRTGSAAPAPEQAALAEGVGYDGHACVRLAAGAGAALEYPWTRLSAGRSFTLTAYARADSDDARLVLSVFGARPEPGTATFLLSREWRRYALPFEVPAGDAPWRRVAVSAEGDGNLWIDAVQLEEGEPTDYLARPEIGVTIADGRGLRRAGEAVTFVIRVRDPAGRPPPVRWRLEDPNGAVVRRGLADLPAAVRGVAAASVRFGHLERGGYRFVAQVHAAGRELTEDTTLASVSWELGGPEPWFAARYAAGSRAQAALELLRIGLHRGIVPPPAGEPVPWPLARSIAGMRRAGIASIGLLPEPVGDAEAYRLACLAAVRRFGGGVRMWELPPGLGGPHRQAAFDGVKQADRSMLLLADTPPADAIILPAQAGERLAEQARELGDLPFGVASEGLPARPWDASFAAVPPDLAAALTPVGQAARLVREIVLARAAGAAFYLYPGAPQGDRDATLTVAGIGRSADLYDLTGAPLPAVAALDLALDETRDRRLAERIDLGVGAACLRWQGRRPLAVLWQTWPAASEARYRLALPGARLSVRDCFGRLVPGVGIAETEIALTSSPVWVESAGVGYQDFAVALRAGVLTGVPQVAAVLERGELRLRNVSNREASGTIRGTAGGAPYGPMAPGAEMRTAWPATWAVVESAGVRMPVAEAR